MSSADIAVSVFLELKNEDFRVLQAIETAMSEHEFVSKEQIARFTKLDLARDTDFRINRLSRLGLIYRMRGAYTGYTLNYAGYDCLAINGLVKANVLEAFGKPLGVGKEADVYDALKPNGERIAVKFHRLGRISFRQIIRRRSYSTERSASWLYQSRLAAQREYEALQLLFPFGIAVPEPISQNRHVIAMGIIEGGELAEYKDIPRPEKILREILRNTRKAYVKAGIIHADLSEYNIILKPDRHILIIDWPQYITKDHPNAKELLTRDVQNILQYFKRKHKIDANLEETIEYVTGNKRTVTLQARPT
jgi:RIO kinase 2